MSRMERVPNVLMFVALLLPSCGESTATTTDTTDVKNLHADYVFPVDTLEDWATYGDVFVTFTVTNAEPVPLSKEDAERSEGVVISSDLTAEIEDLHWTRPGADSIPSTVTFTWLTSVRIAGEDHPAVSNYGQVLEVGNRYVGLFSRVDSDRWQPLASETMAGIGADGLVVVPVEGPPSPAKAAIDGKSADEVGELLSGTPPYADFSADEGLTPLERYCRVAEAGGPKGVLGLDPCQVAATATTSGRPAGDTPTAGSSDR